MDSQPQKSKIMKGPNGSSYLGAIVISEPGVSARPKDIIARIAAKEAAAKEAKNYPERDKKIDDDIATINQMNAKTMEYREKMGSLGGRRVKKRSYNKRNYNKRSYNKRSYNKRSYNKRTIKRLR